jgi:hypothetical protein
MKQKEVSISSAQQLFQTCVSISLYKQLNLQIISSPNLTMSEGDLAFIGSWTKDSIQNSPNNEADCVSKERFPFLGKSAR